MWTGCRTRPCVAFLKKRAEALAEEAMVHSAEGECGVRLEDGRRIGRLKTALRSATSASLLGRDEQAVDR